MTTRIIAREARLAAALEALTQSRSRAKQFPATLTERQRGDHRLNRRDSTKPQAVLMTVAGLSLGRGMAGLAGGGGYYGGGGGSGGGGGDFGGGAVAKK